MFIELTNSYTNDVPGHDKININPNYIIGIKTSRDNNHKVCTFIKHLDGYYEVKESQEEVMALINAALNRNKDTIKSKNTDKISNILKGIG